MTIAESIKNKLEHALQPSLLEVIDESHHHVGHVGSRAEGESHFRVKISSEKLKSLTKVKQHQNIYKILAEDMDNNNPKAIHALAIEVL